MLEAILAEKRQEVEALRNSAHRGAFESAISSMGPTRDLRSAICKADELSIIAEVKRRSPSKGMFRADLDPAVFSCEYERGGAAAISVLTDAKYFSGSLADLEIVRAVVSLPVLRKDFVIDELQLFQSRASGADAILLIVAALNSQLLAKLVRIAESLGLSALVEVHTREEARVALDAGATIIGINNRNLKTFEVNLSTTQEIKPLIPADICVVAESGIRSALDAQMIIDCDVNAVLVGEALVTALDPAKAIRDLKGGKR